MQEIIHPSDLDVLQNAISEKQLVEKAEMPFLTFIEVGRFHQRLKFKTLSGEYGKQPICLRDARGERSAEGRGQTKDNTQNIRENKVLQTMLLILKLKVKVDVVVVLPVFGNEV